MRTAGAFYADTPHLGGYVHFNAYDLAPFSTNLVLTRNALGDYSLNRTAAGAESYTVVAQLQGYKRIVEALTQASDLPFQNQFGTSAGTTSYPGPAAGIPPFTGATQLTPPTAQPGKGVQITDVYVVYQVGVAALTAGTLSLNRTVYANNVANAITNIPISATALTLTTQANPFVAVRAVTTPTFETTDTSDLTLEFGFTMQNTGTVRVYGLGFHFNFNFN